MSETDEKIGKLLAYAEAQQANSARMEKQLLEMDGRLRTVERKSALNGAISGGVVGVLVATVTAGLKAQLGGS